MPRDADLEVAVDQPHDAVELGVVDLQALGHARARPDQDLPARPHDPRNYRKAQRNVSNPAMFCMLGIRRKAKGKQKAETPGEMTSGAHLYPTNSTTEVPGQSQPQLFLGVTGAIQT